MMSTLDEKELEKIIDANSVQLRKVFRDYCIRVLHGDDGTLKSRMELAYNICGLMIYDNLLEDDIISNIIFEAGELEIPPKASDRTEVEYHHDWKCLVNNITSMKI